MSIKIGINGFGRIGKMVFRLALDAPDIEVVHINDKMDTALMAHLLKYDSVHGRFKGETEYDQNHLIVNGKKTLVTSCSTPSDIPWRQTGVDIVVDSCGKFKTRALLNGHLSNGANKVILSCPADDNTIDKTVVMGANNQDIRPSDRIISNASCTTNCVAIMLKVLIDEFGISKAFMNTVHPMTNNQNLQDGFHSDYRRARSAMNNIIPTSSSAVRATQLIFPEMKGIFDGFATRVPVPDCSFVELTAQLGKNVCTRDIHDAYRKYADSTLKGYLEYCTDPVVSTDITDNNHSAIYDSLATKVLGGDLVQILGWYDNECGYSSRIIDLIRYISQK